MYDPCEFGDLWMVRTYCISNWVFEKFNKYLVILIWGCFSFVKLWFFTRSVGHSVKVQKAHSLAQVCSVWGGVSVVQRESGLVTSSTTNQAGQAYWRISRPTVCSRTVSGPVQECGHPEPLRGRVRIIRETLVKADGDVELEGQARACCSHFTSRSSPGAHLASAASSSISFPYPHPNGHDQALHNHLSPALAFNLHSFISAH